MSRFVRNLLVAQAVIFLVTQFAMAWGGLPLWTLLGVFARQPYGYLWQWATHPLIEAPGSAAVFQFGISLFVAWLTYPRIEATFGRRWLLTAMALSSAVGGLAGVAVARVANDLAPASGSGVVLYGLWAFEAWARRNAPPSALTFPFPNAPVIMLNGRQIIASLAAIALVFLIVGRFITAFVVDIGAIAGGILTATLRERLMARTTRTSAFGVIRGGRDRRDHSLH